MLWWLVRQSLSRWINHGSAWKAKMTGLSLLKSSSKSGSLNPWRVLGLRLRLHEVDTLTTRIFRSGKCSRMMDTAARVSSVGTSPQQAMTHRGPYPGHCWLTAGCRCPRRNAGRRIHGEPLQRRVLARDHDVDVVPAPQAVVTVLSSAERCVHGVLADPRPCNALQIEAVIART